MATATRRHPGREIKYPDGDGKPMSEHDLQYKWIVVIKEGVEAQFTDEPNVYVAGDHLWYPVEGNNKIRQGPDILVAIGRPRRLRGSYKQWEEGGIAPQVVFEVQSPGNRRGELKRKFEFYQQYEVEEYYLYDPFRGTLRGWLRVGQSLEEIPVMAGFVSPRLGIRFEPGKGPDNLTIIGRNGERFLTYPEVIEQRDAERQRAEEVERLRAAEAEPRAQAEQRAESAEQRAESAEQRAESAEQRAESAEQRADRYAAMLRDLGIEPE
jgi:Uma2 family endonuclease